MMSLNRHAVWTRIPYSAAEIQNDFFADGTSTVCCPGCHLICQMGGAEDDSRRCPRCGTSLRRRKKNSIARTWALILAGMILYVPANMLPITVITSFGSDQTDTIMSGVIYFLRSGMWPIGVGYFCGQHRGAVVETVGAHLPVWSLFRLDSSGVRWTGPAYTGLRKWSVGGPWWMCMW